VSPSSTPCAAALIRVVTAASLDMAMVDREGRFLEVSPSIIALVGMEREKLIGQRVANLFGGIHTALLAEVLSAPAPVTLPPALIAIPQRGSQWFQTTFTPWWGNDGAFGGMLSITRNITAEQVAQAELARTEALLDAIVESSPSMLSVQNLESGDHIRVNRATEEFLGLSRDEILNRGQLTPFGEELASSIARR